MELREVKRLVDQAVDELAGRSAERDPHSQAVRAARALGYLQARLEVAIRREVEDVIGYIQGQPGVRDDPAVMAWIDRLRARRGRGDREDAGADPGASPPHP